MASQPPLPPIPTKENPKVLYKLSGTEKYYDEGGDLTPQVIWRQYTWAQTPATLLAFPVTLYRTSQWAMDNNRNRYDPTVIIPKGDPKPEYVIKGECGEESIAPDPTARYDPDYNGPWRKWNEERISKTSSR